MAKKKSKKPAKKKAKKAVKKAAPRKAKTAKKKSAKPAKKTAKKPVKKAVKKTAAKATAKAAAPPDAPTNKVNVYLNFNGNCEDAFNFYRSVFGGNFQYLGRFREMPPMDGKPIAEELGDRIMHVSLPISKETILMGSDTAEGFGPPFAPGNNFSVSISAKSRSEAERIYTRLAEGGSAVMPMGDTFWGSYFGMLNDKYGINWMVSHESQQKK